MNNIIITVFMSFGFFLNSFAQENFLTGYYVNNEEDTIKGLIDYRNWSKNPEHFVFKSSLENVGNKVRVDEVKVFSVSNEVYLSAKVDIEKSSRKGILSDSPHPKLEQRIVFLQQLISGSIGLYSYIDSGDMENYYLKINGEYILLIYKKYKTVLNTSQVTNENNKFIGQLIVYLKECENIKEELNGIEYKRNDLEKIIRSYYSCIGEDVKFYRESEPFLIDFGVIMGFTVSQLNYQKIDNREVVKTLSDSNNPLIGFSIEFTLPRNLGKWSFYNSFYYTNYKFKSTYNYFKNDRNYYISETKMESDFIKVLNYIRYKYYRGNIDLFINAGITNGFPISTVITTQKTGIYYSREFENLYDIHNDFRSFENGIAIGTGINWKHIQMEIHIEKTINKSKFQSNSALVTRCEGVINYTF